MTLAGIEREEYGTSAGLLQFEGVPGNLGHGP